MKIKIKLIKPDKDKKKYCKVRDHYIFHNGYNYDYHFIIKELAEEFEGQFTCLGENNKKYITFFSFNRKRSYKIDKNGKEITKTISYRLQFLDSKILMASSLSNLVDGVHKIECKYGHDKKLFDLKVYNVSNCLNKYLTHFVWYFEKGKRYDIKTFLIDRY